MEGEVLSKIISALKDGENVICSSVEERNWIIGACLSAGIHLSNFTKALARNNEIELAVWLRHPNANSCYVRLGLDNDGMLCSYSYHEHLDDDGYYGNALYTSSFKPPESDSDFDSRFTTLLSNEMGWLNE